VTEAEKESARDPALPPKTQLFPGELESKSEEAIPTPPCAATTCPKILTWALKTVDPIDPRQGI